MFKEYLILSAAGPGRHRECQDYVINRHAAAVLKHPAFEGVFERYNMGCPIDIDARTALMSLYPQRPDIPLIVEHVCADAALFRTALEDEAHKAAIKPDEVHIVTEFLAGPPVAVEMEESVVFADARPAPFRTFDFLRRREDVSEAAFFEALNAEAAYLAAASDYRAVVSKRVHNRLSKQAAVYAQSGGTGASTGRAFDAVVESWSADLLAVSAFHPAMRERYRRFVDDRESFSVLTEERILIRD